MSTSPLPQAIEAILAQVFAARGIVTEAAPAAPEPPLADLVATFDPVAGSTMRKLAAGKGMRDLNAEEFGVVGRSFVHDQFRRRQ